jgi:dTDP-glucose 4,6-dehydratase
MVEGIYRLLLSKEFDPVNIGNPVETSILELAELINRLTDNSSGITFIEDFMGESDPQRRKPDITRAKNILHWKPKTSLEDGILRTIPYFREKMGLA